MNPLSILTYLSIIPNLFEVVDQSVKSVETSLSSVPGIAGSTKFEAAKTKVNAVLTAAGHDLDTVTQVGGALGPLINASVSIFNSAGLFKHATPSSATAVK